MDAAANGVHIANYTHAEPVERQPDGSWQVRLKDTLSGDVFVTRAKKLVDATGAWSKPGAGTAPRLVRGSHLILPRLTAEEHAVAHFDDDGRIVFLIPWGSEKQLTLLGTTDVDHTGGPGEARISREEMDYLLGIAGKLYPNASIKPFAAFSSLRPLIDEGDSSATAASREHHIFNTKDGVLRIQGGKYTIYRLMSQEAANLILKEIAPWLMSPSKTAAEPLNGNTAKALSRLKGTRSAWERRIIWPPSMWNASSAITARTRPMCCRWRRPKTRGPSSASNTRAWPTPSSMRWLCS